MSTEQKKPSLRGAAAAVMRQNGFEPEFSADRHSRSSAGSTTKRSRLVRETCARCSGRRSTTANRATSTRSSQRELSRRLIRIRIGVADVGTLVPRGSAAEPRRGEHDSVYTGVAVFPMLPDGCPPIYLAERG